MQYCTHPKTGMPLSARATKRERVGKTIPTRQGAIYLFKKLSPSVGDDLILILVSECFRRLRCAYKTRRSVFLLITRVLLHLDDLLRLHNYTSSVYSQDPLYPAMAAAVSRRVVQKVLAIETAEVCKSRPTRVQSCANHHPHQGEGALVRRSIGSMKLRNLTPFLMLDHFHVSKGAVSVTTICCS